MARDAVIIGAVRTAIGKRNGALSQSHAADLSGQVLNALVARTGIDPELVDDVIWGCVAQIGDQSTNVGRLRRCSRPAGRVGPRHHDRPGLRLEPAGAGVRLAGVISGHYDLVVAGGVEVMTRVPLGASRQGGFPYGPRVMARYDNFEFNQGAGAELIAAALGPVPPRLDEFAARSHELAAAAIDAGAFDEQLVPVPVKSRRRRTASSRSTRASPRHDPREAGHAQARPSSRTA